MNVWDHHAVRGAFRMASVALGYITRLKPGEYYTAESLAREVASILYSSAPKESQAAAYHGVLEVMTILTSELSYVVDCPPLGKLPGEDELAYTSRLKAEASALARVTPEHFTSQ